jgi:hypothetical protein
MPKPTKPTIKAAGDFLFIDSGGQYRIKLKLSDGRFVYLTDGSQFTILDKTGLVADPRLEDVFLRGAYSSDLLFFGTRDLFESDRQSFLVPVETIPELVDTPVDRRAFVLGGFSVLEFIAMHRDPKLS